MQQGIFTVCAVLLLVSAEGASAETSAPSAAQTGDQAFRLSEIPQPAARERFGTLFEDRETSLRLGGFRAARMRDAPADRRLGRHRRPSGGFGLTIRRSF